MTSASLPICDRMTSMPKQNWEDRGTNQVKVKGDISARRLGWIDLNFECSTVCPILPRLMGIWHKRLGRRASQPKPRPRPNESPCSSVKTPCSPCTLKKANGLPTSCKKNLWTASWSEKSGSLGPREAAARLAANRRRSRSFFLKSGFDLK